MNVLPNKSEVKAQYRDIIKSAEVLAKLEGDPYYKAQEELNKKLREFVKTDFSVLSTQELLKIISLVSSHRPMPLHSFLISCSLLVK